MRKKVRKSLAFLLALALVVSVMSGLGLSVSAEEEITSPGTETVQPVEEEVKEEKKETGTEESKTDVEPTTEAVEPVAETEESKAKTEETPSVAASAANGLTASNDVAVYASGNHAIIKNEVSNATVLYYRYNATSRVWESTVYTSDFTIDYYSQNDPYTYHLFFVKPTENYLLENFMITNNNGATEGYDLYSTANNAPENSQISHFTDINKLVTEAKAAGYLGYCGYTSAVAGNVTLTQHFKGRKPALQVIADANPKKNVQPGQNVHFTVTITPEKAQNDKVTALDVTELKIGEHTYSKDQFTLVRNDDGTYTIGVDYMVTETDWRTGKIKLDVTAEINYEYDLKVKDRYNQSGTITTSSTITNTGSTTVEMAENYGVTYELRYAPTSVTPPTTIPPAPTDSDRYFVGASVSVEGYDDSDVDDPTNGGTWTFSGWSMSNDGQEHKSGTTVAMVEGGIDFVGTWTFKPYPTRDLTITKEVSGGDNAFNLNVTDITYTFKVTGDKLENGKTYTVGESTVTVQNNALEVSVTGTGSVTIEDLPVGKYTVMETGRSKNPEGYEFDTSTVTTGTATLTNMADGKVTITNQYKIKELKVTVEKVVTGNMGDTNQEFSFTSGNKPFELKDGGKQEFTVKYGEAFTVTETDADQNGYTTSYKVDDGDAEDGGTCAIDAIKADTTITFTNKKQINPPMGVITTIAPYAIMVVLAAGAGVYFVYSRRRHNG